MSITIPVVLSGGGDKCDENIPATHWGSDNPVEEAIALLHLIYYRQHILFSISGVCMCGYGCAGDMAWHLRSELCNNPVSLQQSGFILKDNSNFCSPWYVAVNLTYHFQYNWDIILRSALKFRTSFISQSARWIGKIMHIEVSLSPETRDLKCQMI